MLSRRNKRNIRNCLRYGLRTASEARISFISFISAGPLYYLIFSTTIDLAGTFTVTTPFFSWASL